MRLRPDHLRTPLLVLVASLLTVAGCSDQNDPAASDRTANPTEEVTTDAPTADPTTSAPEPSESATADGSTRFPECEPGEGRTVTMLEDIVLEEQEIPGITMADVQVGGATVAGFVVEPVVIPERVVEQGCLITYDAPGGCLPAVEISGAYIPGYTVPERVLPEVTLPDGTVLEEQVIPAVGADEVVIDGARAEEVCQAEPAEEGDYVFAVHRFAIHREPGHQFASHQFAVHRAAEQLDEGTVPGISLPGASVEGVSVPGQSIPGESLEGYRLEGAEDVEVADGEDEVYYSSQGDVLFDKDEATIRPEAEETLQAIVDDIAERGAVTAIRVEGHTDDVGSDQHNLDLSERRAAAVADWLVDAGLDRDLMTTEGLGEGHPRADNDTEEGRAENRRVVITVEIG